MSSFEKFIESPVSLHTGLHDVTIPVHSFKLRGISIPIALKYHSGGIKVDELASEVGLGWSLEAGGVVSSTVHGLPDELGDWPNSYYPKIDTLTLDNQYSNFTVSQIVYELNSEDPFSLYDVYENSDISFVRGALRGQRDSEPDLFFFSMPGKSGKFFADGTNTFRTIPHQKVVIERILSGNIQMGYKIIDEQGNAFEFMKKGTSLTTSESFCTSSGPTGIYQPEYPHSSFHLTKITTIIGDTVDFYYSPYSYTIKNPKQFSRMGRGEGDDFDCTEFIRPEEDVCLGLTQSTTVFNTFTLDSIKTNLGQKAVFSYQQAGRLDKGVRSLDTVSIFAKEGGAFELIKDFSLHQSYFVNPEASTEDPTLKYRMRLDSAGEVGKPAYVFSYDPTLLPLRLSFSQDHWGFSNGKVNPHLLPREDHNGFETGADREPDFNFAKAGILTSLQYPTGGTLEFEYEPNTYYSEGGELYYTNEGTLLHHQAESVVTTSFTILSNSKRKKFFWTNSDDGLTTHNDFCIIEITGPNNYFRQLYGDSPVFGELVTLEPGTYTIRIETFGTTFGGSVTVTWLNEWAKEAGNRVTGGVRIKSSKNCPGNGEDCILNKYEYVREDITKSSGIIFQSPLYTHTRDRVFWKVEDGFCQPNQINCSPTLQSSSSITPLYSSQGTHIVYDHVVLYKETSEETGKTTFKFLVDKSQNPNYNAPPFPYVVTYDWLNGLPLETTQYAFKNQQFVPVKKTTNQYVYEEIADGLNQFTNQYSARGVRINLYDYPSGIRVQCGLAVTYFLPPVVFEFVPFRLISSWHYLTQTVDVLYTEAGEEALTQTTAYHYDNSEHIQITREIQSDSKGNTISVNRTYPLDYPGIPNSAIIKMKDSNIVTPVIEEKVEKIIGGVPYLLKSNLTIYSRKNQAVFPAKTLKLDLAQPINATTFMDYTGGSFDSRYSVEIEVDTFDVFNNVIQYRQKTGIVKSLIWDYTHSSIIAEVTNATINQVAYTSFESENLGNWSIAGGSTLTNDSFTGQRCLSLTNDLVSRSNLLSGMYKVSFWAKSGASIQVIGENTVEPMIVGSSGDWNYYVCDVQVNSNVQIQGNAIIDELRLYPTFAQMNSFTYKPEIGLSSITDQNGFPVFYKYDEFGRLKAILDYKQNTLVKHDYKYKRNP